MTEDQDDAGEVVAGAVRVALTAAGQLAEQAARRREADLREAEQESAARVATLQSQLAAERELALRSVRDVVQRGDTATADEVVRAWEQARSWDDPTMAIEQARLEERVLERFGVKASSRAVGRTDKQMTATASIARDVKLQAHDARQRGMGPDPVEQQPTLASIGLGDEAVAARMLAANSYPIQATEATRRPQAIAARSPRGRQAGRATEVQGRGM